MLETCDATAASAVNENGNGSSSNNNNAQVADFVALPRNFSAARPSGSSPPRPPHHYLRLVRSHPVHFIIIIIIIFVVLVAVLVASLLVVGRRRASRGLPRDRILSWPNQISYAGLKLSFVVSCALYSCQPLAALERRPSPAERPPPIASDPSRACASICATNHNGSSFWPAGRSLAERIDPFACMGAALMRCCVPSWRRQQSARNESLI
jgi:hypothetical protein